MLRELHISNLAVIADARIELHAGLNCFTGATGAGKSLVIGAVELLLGLRSPAELLRTGVEEGRVTGLFDVADARMMREIEAVTDIPVGADGGELLIARRLYASGRSSVSLNGHPITLAMLKRLAEHLVDVHGQHDHQYLLRSANQLDVLDAFAGIAPLRAAYHAVYVRLREARRELEELATSRQLREQQLELYRFGAAEIDAAELDAAEYDELAARSAVLRNLEKLKKDAGLVHAALYEADGAVLDRLKMMVGVLAELGEIDPAVKAIGQGVRDATLQLEEAAFDLSRYLDRLELDPAEAVEVEQRLNTIHRALNKYGPAIADALARRAALAADIAALEKASTHLTAISGGLAPLQKELAELGAQLTAARTAAAKKLAPLIEAQLAQLGMEKAKFQVAVTRMSEADGDEAAASGMDVVEFVVQTNPGQAPQPLRKIASGGELSRIMLALKSVFASADRVSILVFDEIDANVGGRLGAVLGEKLRALAKMHQVICITHLPQIASYADRHLTVRKEARGAETRTTVRTISGEERVEELAEMIGGTHITTTTRQQARELLEGATAPRPPARAKARGPASNTPPG